MDLDSVLLRDMIIKFFKIFLQFGYPHHAYNIGWSGKIVILCLIALLLDRVSEL